MGFEGRITPESPKHERIVVAEMPLDEYNKLQVALSEMVYNKYHQGDEVASSGSKMFWWIQHGYARALGDMESVDVEDLEGLVEELESSMTRH